MSIDKCPAVVLGILIALAGTAVPAQTPINACNPATPPPAGSLIQLPGNYIVNANLTSSASADCIKITASNVGLKLNGKSIKYTGAALPPLDVNNEHPFVGINVQAAAPSLSPCSGTLSSRLCRVGIEGPGLIQGFPAGILMTKVDASQVDLVTLLQNQFGFIGADVTFLTVASNVIGRSAYEGLTLDGTTSSVVAHNDVSGNGTTTSPDYSGHGINITCASICSGVAKDNTVNNNTANGNGLDGIKISTHVFGVLLGTRVYGNVTDGNGSFGVEVGFGLMGSPGTQVFNNTSLANKAGDLFDDSSTNPPPGCSENFWSSNVFFTAQPTTCVH
jgi:hypothetical protein